MSVVNLATGASDYVNDAFAANAIDGIGGLPSTPVSACVCFVFFFLFFFFFGPVIAKMRCELMMIHSTRLLLN
jgi:hypothetical protein